MILTNEHFEQIKANLAFEYDVSLEKFNATAKTLFFEFDAYYKEKDVIDNQHVISPLKIKFEFYSEVIPEELELSGVQKKEVARWLKEFYEGEYTEAKEEWLKEKENELKSPIYYSKRYVEEMNALTSDWYN